MSRMQYQPSAVNQSEKDMDKLTDGIRCLILSVLELNLLKHRRYDAASLTSWILLRGLYPRANTGTFIHRGIKESVVHERYAENTYRSHEA